MIELIRALVCSKLVLWTQSTTEDYITAVRAMGTPQKRNVLKNPKQRKTNFQNTQMKKEKKKKVDTPSDENGERSDGDHSKWKQSQKGRRIWFWFRNNKLFEEKKGAEKQNKKDDSSTHEQLIRETAEGFETDEEVGPNLKNEAPAKSMSKMEKGVWRKKEKKKNGQT